MDWHLIERVGEEAARRRPIIKECSSGLPHNRTGHAEMCIAEIARFSTVTRPVVIDTDATNVGDPAVNNKNLSVVSTG